MTRRHAGPMAGVLLLAALNGLLWVLLLPPWQAPDEPKHFEYVRLIATTGQVVAFESDVSPVDAAIQAEITESMRRFRFAWYGHGPGLVSQGPDAEAPLRDIWEFGAGTALYRSSPAYYALASMTQVGPAADGLLPGLYAARLLSMALGMVVVGLTAVAARTLAPDDPLVWVGAPAFVALLPTFWQLHASVNSDVLANVLAAFTLLMAVRIILRGPRPLALILLAAGAILAVGVKRTTLFLVPVGGLATVASGLLHADNLRRRLLQLAGVAAAAGFIAVSVWAAGGFDLSEESRNRLLRYFFNEPDQPARIAAYLARPEAWPVLVRYVAGMWPDFWGSFGWQTLELSGWALILFGVLSGSAALGVGRLMLRPGGPHRGPNGSSVNRTALAVLATAPLAVSAAAAAFFLSYLFLPYSPAPQARYLMASVLPIALLLTAGLGTYVPADRRWRATQLFVGFMLAYDVLVLAGYVVPYFYQ